MCASVCLSLPLCASLCPSVSLCASVCLCVSLCVSVCFRVFLCASVRLSVCGVAGEGLGRPGASLRWKSVSQVFVGTFVWVGWVSKGQGVGRLGAIYLNLPQVTLGREFLNMRRGPCHLDIRTEMVFHTTSEPAGSGHHIFKCCSRIWSTCVFARLQRNCEFWSWHFSSSPQWPLASTAPFTQQDCLRPIRFHVASGHKKEN